MSRIIVLGSGAWGTAIALSLCHRGGHQVTLWAHSPEMAQEIIHEGQNKLFLPGFPLPAELTVTGDETAVANAEIVVSVVPSKFLRSMLARLRPQFHPGQVIVSATKGIENQSFLRMSQVIAACLAEKGAAQSSLDLPIGVFSGPTFAQEVAQGQPTAVTVAFDDPAIAARIQTEFSSESLRLYTSADTIGVELGGALKNVIAIAAGVAAGVGLGHNTTAALVTRGIAEITRLAVACGGHRETLAGLSGVGDVVLTCTGSLSRNRTVGQELGRGRKLPEILDSLGGKVAEGVMTTRATLGLAHRHGIEMPIAEQVEMILNEGKAPHEAIRELMLRPGKDEV
jgi:glycerol-3-phosphate dehydrogenase (NAD(P)+)